MISDEKAKQILNKGKRKYTDNEVRSIKEIIQEIIEVDIKRLNNEKGNHIHTGFNR